MKYAHFLLRLALVVLPATLQAQTVELIKMPLAELQAKADSGDAPAMIQLGIRYNLGIGIAHSLKTTQQLMQKAKKAGSLTATGICALNAWGQVKDAKLAFKSLEKASATGDLTAIRNLARCYQTGTGCEKNPSKAFELFQKAAVADDPAGIYFLALAHRNGIGTEEDAAKSTEMLEQAAANSSFLKAELAECYQKGIGCLKDDARAVELYTEAADAGYALAMRLLGGRYWNGNGVTKDLAKAHELYQKAGELGEGQAWVWLASDYFTGNGVEKSFAKYVELMLKAAENDYPSALISLGINYENGNGVTKDIAKANELYQKAGDLGDGMGYRNLGNNYANGNGVTKDLAKANELYQKAGDLGDGGGYLNLGVNYENGKGVSKDLAKANELYQKAGDLGDGMGYRFLGTNYANGIGATKNPDKAEEFYLKAGALGDGFGYFNLGHAYREGTWRTKDEAKAFGYYQKGAELNHSDSVLMVGWCNEYGSGVPKDAAQAATFYQKAAAMGNFAAMSNLGSFLRDGVGIPKDLPKAVEWFQKSADGGNSYGQYNLGKLYSSGRGVKKDMVKAVELFTKSSAQDQPAATFDLGSCYENGLGVKRDKAKARELYEKAAKLGNTDAQQRLKDLGPAPKKSAATRSPSGPTGDVRGVDDRKGKSTTGASEEVTQLLTQARRELDLEQFEPCITRCQSAISKLDAAKESDWQAWSLAHATLGAAYFGAGAAPSLTDPWKVIELYENAQEAVQAGLLIRAEKTEALKSAHPDRYARLLEVRAMVHASWTAVNGVPEKEKLQRWFVAAQSLEDALAATQNPAFLASIHTTAARCYIRQAGRYRSAADAETAVKHAEDARRYAETNPASKLPIAKAVAMQGWAVITLAVMNGATDADFEQPEMAKGERLLREAAPVLREMVPGTVGESLVRQELAEFDKSHRAKSWNNFAKVMNMVTNSVPAPSADERQRVLRGMANENYNARQQGRPEPHPGIR